MKLETMWLVLKTVTLFSKALEKEKFAYCESYNAAACDQENKKDCYTQEKCGTITSDQHNHCFILWEHNSVTDVSEVKMKGCFLNNKDCYENQHCTEKSVEGTNQFYFCCCNGHMCNQNITYENTLIKKTDAMPMGDMEIDVFFTSGQFVVLLPMLVTICFFIAVSIFIGYLCNQRSESGKMKLSNVESGESPVIPAEFSRSTFPQLQYVNEVSCQSDNQVSDCSLMSSELIEKKASGRFGAIWKARRRSGEIVAVKVFPLREKQSWRTELNVFSLPGIHHEDLLKFIGACRVGDGLKVEFWLFTDYCENGSLYDYLRENTITGEELFNITMSIARGLRHLHLEQCDPTNDNYKPAIAHRDFKSKNVLLKGIKPIRVCIADFNLALMIEDCGSHVNQCGRVGTLRYMAPEVLDGAINFRKETILAIDMYACALVLWELLSRCKIDENPVSDYEIPFQTAVGLMPTLKEMHDCVVCKQLRPQIKEAWKKHTDLAVICNVIEECWDLDPDARISSSTVLERISPLEKSLKTTSLM